MKTVHKILLVDDEVNVGNALKRVLRLRFPDELKVETFDNPELALQRLHEASFDIVVSDFRMPQMNGIAFLERAGALQPHVVRLILSASTEVETVMQAVNQVGVFRYLTKPWLEDELVGHIRAALDKASKDREDRQLADDMRVRQGTLSPAELELKRLEQMEPGLTKVEWGPNGEVIMPDLLGGDLH